MSYARSILLAFLTCTLAPLASGARVEDRCDAIMAELAVANDAINRGDFILARRHLAAAVATIEGLTTPGECAAEREGAARVAFAAKEYAACRRLWLVLLAAREAEHGADAVPTAVARCNAGIAAFHLGDVETAEREVGAGIAALRVADQQRGELANALSLMALVRGRRGDLAGAIALQTEVVETMEREFGADHDSVLQARLSLAVQHHIAGDFARAQELSESAIAVMEQRLPAGHPELLEALQNLASTLHARGEAVRAAEIHERILATREGLLRDDDFLLQVSRLSVAAGLTGRGDLARARELTERAIEVLRRTPGVDPAVLLQGRANLAAILYLQRDYAASVRVQNEVLDAQVAQFGARHPAAIGARRQLATMLMEGGDAEAGRVLSEVVLPDCLAVLGPDHPETVYALQNLLALREEAGRYDDAVSIAAEILAARERTGGDDPGSRLLRAMAAARLARNEFRAGRTAEARERLARALAEYEALPASVATNSGWLLKMQGFAEFAAGDAPAARARLARLVEESATRNDVPREDSAVLHTELAWLMAADDAAALEPVLLGVVEEARACLAELDGASSRDAWARIARLESAVSVLASRVPRLAAESAVHVRWFELLEELRAAGDLALANVRRAAVPPELQANAERARELRRQIQDLVAARGLGAADDAALLADLVRRRDAAENELARGAGRHIVRHARIDEPRVRAMLAPDEVALLYREVDVEGSASDTSANRTYVRRLLVHVVDRTQTTRVDLGPADAIRALVTSWRAEIARGEDRGLATAASPDSERAFGRRLHAAVVAPALAGREGVRKLLVALDGALHLAPFDALPIEDGGRHMLDAYDVAVETSLLGRLAPRAAAAGAPSLLALGGIDYNARLASSAGGRVLGVAPPVPAPPGAAPPDSAPPDPTARADESERAGPLGTNWLPLPATAAESNGIAALFESAFGRPGHVLQRAEATKDAFTTLAEGARCLHVATHGYFADQVLASSADAPGETLFQRAVRGLAPSALCGLALAGANGGMDALGRVPGVITAEEIAGLDLSECELAVLSACDTGVGLVRPGRSPSTLHAAFHAAGARVVVASLWKVPDEDTRDFFGDFYTRLWVEGLAPGAALRAAKRAAAKSGRPPRSWAAWVLTGDAG